ncbi:MAG TPA: M20/M25/M40 family metallo-hydrolase [Gammaproteobacteria bacterium]|jgi:glutamate carboxypeptidase|nr:M20/M25/M40 family metallo-hydrolase [Gammaproteobacteria bacterium]
MKNKSCFIPLLATLTLLFSMATNASNESAAKQITGYATTHQAEQLSLLKKLVNINSSTDNIRGVYQVGEVLRLALKNLGFITHWSYEPKAMKRAGTLIAHHPGSQGKKLLLIGHLDTVALGYDHKTFPHFEEHDDKATGPGIVDDKGGDVIILYALKALQAQHNLAHADITVVFTGDEEDSGKPTVISRKPLIEAAKKADIALDFESAVTLNTASIARRGISDWIIQAEGMEGHSAGIFQESIGFGAIFELARIVDTMRTALHEEKYLTFNPGLILGGSRVDYNNNDIKGTAFGKQNIIPRTAIAIGDLRFLTVGQKVEAEKKITAIVESHLNHTKASITFQDGIPPMEPTEANQALLNQYSDASVLLGYGKISALDPGQRGAGDISYVASLVSASLVGLGAFGGGEHAKNETLDIRSLPMQTQRAALLMYQLTSSSA